MAKYEQLEEQLKYMKSVLENDVKPKAVQLKKRSEDFVNCIKRTGSRGALSSDDEGVITLEGNQFPINNNVTNCTSDNYPTMQRKFQEIMDLVGRLEYTSFGISSDIWNAQTSLRNQTTSLTDFDNSFNVYCNDVQSMESNICSLLSKVSGVSNISAFNSSSVISSSGEIDKNKVEELSLKNSGDLTEEDKEAINYIENIYGGEDLETIEKELNNDNEVNVGSVGQAQDNFSIDEDGVLHINTGVQTVDGAAVTYDGNISVDDSISIRDSISNLEQTISTTVSEKITGVNEWLNSTEPTIPFTIPDSNSVIPAIISGSVGSFTESISKIERKAMGYLDGNEIKFYPSNSNVKMYPYENVTKIGSAVTKVTTVLDIGNTWSKDDGNTNWKRIEKTGVQAIGILASLGVGTISGAIAGAGVAAAPESGGISLVAVPAAAAIDTYSAKGISYLQDKIYDKLDIKN